MRSFILCLPLLVFSCTHSPIGEHESLGQEVLTKTYSHPTNGYSQAVMVQANGVATIYISGQVGEGSTLDEQMRNALKNVRKELQALDADFDDLVKINSYIVGYSADDLDTFRGVREELMGPGKRPASTLVGVESLALPEWKIEIDAVAVRPVR